MIYTKPSGEDAEMMQLACDRLQGMGVNATVEDDRLVVRSLGRKAGAPTFVYAPGANAVYLVHRVLGEMLASVPAPVGSLR